MSTLFISYRRSDSKAVTEKLYDRLREEFGPDAVFIDIQSIPLGNDFARVLADVLDRCRVVLAVIGPTWATVADPDGTRRLHDPQDFVRMEVEAALKRQIPVVPVLVGGVRAADLDGRKWKLPESLLPLCRRQVAVVGDGDGFAEDVGKLVVQLRRVLGEGLSELPAEVRHGPAEGDKGGYVGRDRAWPEAAEQKAVGDRLIVLTGPPGIGKTVTANQLARSDPPERHRHIVTIDAAAEFCELSLVEAVGETYPDELYRDHAGVPFSSLTFRNQRHIAIGLLVQHDSTVILDGPGEAGYPRDATAESELALRTAHELAARSVRVIVATRHAAGWAAHNPIPLRGLSPENARSLLRREFRRAAPDDDPDKLTSRLGGEAAVAALVEHGHPGELIAAAHRAANPVAAGGGVTGTPGGFAGRVRRAAEAIFGDPVLPRPRPPGAKSAGPLLLLAICVLLLIVSTLSLTGAYQSGSPMWERMFDRVVSTEAELPALGTATGARGGMGPGWMVEFARSVILVVGFLFIVVGLFFGREAAELLPYPPWRDVGPRRLGLRAVFRVMFVILGAWLAYNTLVHHVRHGPRVLWVCNGNPFLQKHLDGNDRAKVEELRAVPASDRNHMNGEPPGPGEAGYDEYWRQCVFPYRLYFGYSVIMFTLVGTVVLTVCFYAVCASFVDHLITQPRRIGELHDDASPHAVDNRLRFYKETYLDDIDRYLLFLLVLLSAWAYHVWWDQYNLTGSAEWHTTLMILLAAAVGGTLFTALVLTYQRLVREAAKRVPDGPPLDAFHRRHAFFRFFAGAVARSSYFWLCLLAGGAGVLWFVRAAASGWQR